MNENPKEPGSTGQLTAEASSVVRVEKGRANAEELAAVTALLLARAASTRAGEPQPAARRGRPSKAGWRRLERQHGFRAPHSWQG
ncbi:acyl-CoA carboxylase epsilon subunit [Streptomyces qinglanensis]|uniref:Acyl-CoA carboxylase epsilon subunit n=1 Tax=Streptomyces qinglanensis TaxID=943816 RepID=A0A1H9VRU2_9ACTN|nr:acyl-CoA carboxylase epsilon subunit [Streptomyces qinglanensis]SES24292.1 Acyl-CoA carboxylase epsilon subunit [Streptomyces qinglanensis]